ncbi:hypothetical protein CVIRNUC_000743 [Coccomyxa viridis]|uniref:Uncharacterized protein n=1 Tax=Coccomyxa viridis TaxID=1274662 RepID=A0AAV1HSC8_9CHLO|nr:hypothetical protein CVIRNUC_000743 [Coccomyxa viridis]
MHTSPAMAVGQDFLSRHQMHLFASIKAILHGCSRHERAFRHGRCSFALEKVPCDIEKLVLGERDRIASLSSYLKFAALLLPVPLMLWLCQDSMTHKACGR